MAGHAAHDELVLAGSPCDGRYARHAPQRLVVLVRQRLGRLGEQRGQDGLADSGQGDLPLGVGELALCEAEAFGGA